MKTLLPLGTVVSLAGIDHRIMILGYARYKEGDMSHIYDYVGCYYPEGFISADKTVIFDHSMVQNLYYIGFNNEDSAQFMNKVASVIEESEQNVPGEVVIGAEQTDINE